MIDYNSTTNTNKYVKNVQEKWRVSVEDENTPKVHFTHLLTLMVNVNDLVALL